MTDDTLLFETHIDALLDSLPTAAARIDMSGVTRHANASAERLLGLSRSRIEGLRYDQPALDVAMPDGAPLDFDDSPVPRALRGETIEAFDLLVQIEGRPAKSLMRLDAAPLRRPDGVMVGAVVTVCDITVQRQTEAALRASERRVNAVLNNTTMAVFVMDDNQQCIYANAAAEALTGYSQAEMQGRPLHDVVHHTHPDGRPYPLEDCPIDRAFPENFQVQGEETFVHRDGRFYPVAFTASPIHDETSRTIGTVIEVRGIAEEKRREAERQESETRFRTMADNAPVMMWVTGVDGGVSYLNKAWRAFTGQDPATGGDWRSAVHEADRGWSEARREAASAGHEPYRIEYRLRRADGVPRWVIEAAAPRFSPGGDYLGHIGSVIDIHDRHEAEANLRDSEKQVREGQAFLAAMLDSTGEAFYATDRTGQTTHVNRSFLELLGFDRPEEAVGRRLHDVIHHSHPDGSHYPKEVCPIYLCADQGIAAHVEGENFYSKDGVPIPVEYRAHPLMVEGEHRGAICTFSDISERLAAREALRDQTRALQILNRAAVAVAGDLDLDRLVQTITDAAVEMTGAAFGAFFYNTVDEAGDRYTLYSLAGAPREAFASFPMPRATAIFAPTFEGADILRSDDIMLDPRYGQMGPYHGMPEGHLPVRSYLAVPVRSRAGEVLGGLFFGHPEPGIFGPQHEERVQALASQASVAMDNATLFRSASDELKHRREAEAQLTALNADLERRVETEVAERTRAEDALRQAQKMEAVGQLTGGVAHDFNNLLTVIIGGLETINRSGPEEGARVQRAARMALQGAQRAASLTSRLLAFSRRQPLEPTPLELNLTVRDMTDLLHRTLGEQIELEGILASRLWMIEADQNQLESAILNLAVNARDAMPDGGKLTIETTNTALDENYAATDREVIPGQYVQIAISDTGAGMSPETLSKVFEPFFTTKEVGKGTGLGLSMVYGFVKQSGGHVTIYSEPGEGTTVKLYFPRFLGAREAPAEVKALAIPRGRADEVILVLEDSDDVRAYSVMILQELGYTVLQAEEGGAALDILRSDQKVDLLFTDVVLPGPSGRDVADAATALRPGLPVLFTTGYSRNAIVHHGRLDAGVQLVSKPFTFEQLATRIRDVLDQAPGIRQART